MEQLKLDAFLQYQFLSGIKYAPGGKQAALVVSKADEKNNCYESAIYLYRNKDFFKLTGLNKEGSFLWEDETHILFPAARLDAEKEAVKNGNCTIYYRLSTGGGEAQPAFTLPFEGQLKTRLNDHVWICEGSLDPEYPDFYLMSEEEKGKVRDAEKKEEDYEILTEVPFYFNGMGFTKRMLTAIYLYDTRTDKANRITGTDLNAGNPLVLGDKVYFLAAPADNTVDMDAWEVYVYDTAEGEQAIPVKLTDTPGQEIYNLSLLGSRLIASMQHATKMHINEENKLYEISPEDGSTTLFLDNKDSLYNSTGSDCRYGGGQEFLSVGNKLYFVKTMRNDAKLYSIDCDGVLKEVSGHSGSVDDFAVSEDGQILVIGMFDGKLQEVYEISDEQKRQLSSFNEAILKDVYTSEYHKLTIESRGWDIDGWVLYPKDFDFNRAEEEIHKYPAIFDIHGGPRTVYGEIFYHEMQLWANMGYFVFFCNPVGSSGRGLEFADITDAYGSIDFDNLMDFTDAVLEKYPQIDPKRVGCTGGSYGGFMSNWILGHTDRFAAIATQRSISNWISFYGVSDIGYVFVENQLGQDPFTEEGFKRCWEMSPLKYRNNMKTPTLFIHSDEDYRCPMEQGLQLYTSLKMMGVPTRFVWFKGENHDLSRSGKPLHRKKRLKEITDWMEKYVKQKA